MLGTTTSRIRSLFMLIAIISMGCEGIRFEGVCNFDSIHMGINDTIEMQIGEVYCNQANGIRLECDSLVNDSRCPIGATCVWEGNAELSFILEQDSELLYEFNLNTNPGFRTDTTINDLRYKLLDLLPYPELDTVPDLDDYTILLIVYKN
jgi:hypothetical protein